MFLGFQNALWNALHEFKMQFTSYVDELSHFKVLFDVFKVLFDTFKMLK